VTLRAKWRSGDRFLVRHVDRSILVVEKKAGLLTHATESGRGENLMELLREFVASRGPGRLLPVHRLDRVVSGLLVYARNQRAQDRLIEQFEAHDVERIYTAAVTGVLEQDSGTYKSLLYTEDPSLVVYSVDRPREGARPAVTHWKVLTRYPEARATLVEVQLETGLRNQIRVHFAEDDHPLLGERKYQPDPDRRSAQENHRVFLHAGVLGFRHPDDGRILRFEAPLPSELAKWSRALEEGDRRRPTTWRGPRGTGPRSGEPRRGAPRRGPKRPSGRPRR